MSSRQDDLIKCSMPGRFFGKCPPELLRSLPLRATGLVQAIAIACQRTTQYLLEWIAIEIRRRPVYHFADSERVLVLRMSPPSAVISPSRS
jgi:hypothetical protein